LVLGLSGLLPGWAALSFLAPRIDRAGRLGTALALSPILGGALVAMLVGAGLSWTNALLSILATSLAVIALRRVLPRIPGPDVRGEGPRAAWIAALACVVILGAMYAGSEWWRLDSDAWTHAPIVRALRDHGLPAQDPWYAGFALQYAWLYHAWVAALVDATGLDPFVIMSFLAVLSLAAVALVTGHLASRLHGRQVGWTTAFVLLAMNGAFVFTLPVLFVQALVGVDAGPQVVARIFGGVFGSADKGEALLRWFGAQTWFGNKFAGATPLSLGLAALVAWLASFWRALESGARDRRELLLLVLCSAAVGAFHPVLLLFTGATMLAWFGLVLMFDNASWRPAGRIALAAIVGAIAPALYFAGLLAPSAGNLAPPIDLSLPKLVGLLLCTLPGLVFAGVAARGFLRAGGANRLWILWLGAALAFSLALRLPGAWAFFTVDKTSYLLWIPLALTGGAVFGDWLARRGLVSRAVIVALVLVPPTLLALTSRARDPRTAWHQPWNRSSLTRLRAGLPRDAILIVPPGDIDSPVFLARDTFDEDKIDGFVRGYDPFELDRRHALVDTLYRAGRLAPALVSRLVASGRPVYAVWPDMDRDWQARVPGVPQRKFVTQGLVPAWVGVLPVHAYGDDYALSPLTPGAKLP
jgi:hypothetical protein